MATGTEVKVRISGDASGLRSAAEHAQQSLGRVTSASERTLGAIQRMGHAGAALYGLQTLATYASTAAQALWQAGEQAERTRNLLNLATAGQGAQALADVRVLADRLGLSLTETAAAYGQFAAAARGTTLEGQSARQVFTAVSEAAAAMGLSAGDTSGVLLALQQMVSKGTVSAEELRGQLGERLPGAFQIAARAMGVTTAELGKMLEQGQVTADDFLPRFANQLREELGGAAEDAANRMGASTARMGNAWSQLLQAMGNAGTLDVARSVIQGLTNDVQAVADAMDVARVSGSSWLGQMGSGLSTLLGRASGMRALTDAYEPLDVRLANAGRRVQDLKGRAQAGDGQNIYLRSDLAEAEADLAHLTKARQAITGDDGSAGSDYRLSRHGEGAAATEQRLADARKAVADATQKAAGVNAEYLKGLEAIGKLMAADPSYDPASDATALAVKYGKPLVDAAKAGAGQAEQAAKARSDLTVATERAASDARLRVLNTQMDQAARLRDQDVLSAAGWADRQIELIRQVEAEQLAQNAGAQAAVRGEQPRDEAGRLKQATELAKLRGEAARVTDEALAAEAAAVEQSYQHDARAFEEAASTLRQAVDQVRGQIQQTTEANAQAAIDRISDPIARAAAVAAYQVRRSREETEREIALLQARIAALRAAGGNGLEIGDAETAIAGLRTGQQQTEAVISARLADDTQPQFKRLLADWGDTTRQMRETWDASITQMTDGAADAFGRFVSGQQVNLRGLAQQMAYTMGRGLFQQLAGQAANSLGLTQGSGGRQVGGKGGSAEALDESADAISVAAQDSSGALSGAAGQIVQSALGWLLPQATQTAASATLSGAAMALMGAATALTSAAAAMGASSMASGAAGVATLFARRGATYGVTPFAQGGAFQRGGEVLSGPTMFQFRDGVRLRRGVAGEAGPEAALPLKRGASGQLGVTVHGAGRGVLPLSRGGGGVLGVDLGAVKALALGRQPRAGRAVRNGARTAFALGGVFGEGARGPAIAVGAQALRQAQAQGDGVTVGGSQRAQLVMDMRSEIHIDARTDQAQVAQAVAAAQAAQERRLWKTFRERGIA